MLPLLHPVTACQQNIPSADSRTVPNKNPVVHVLRLAGVIAGVIVSMEAIDDAKTAPSDYQLLLVPLSATFGGGVNWFAKNAIVAESYDVYIQEKLPLMIMIHVGTAMVIEKTVSYVLEDKKTLDRPRKEYSLVSLACSCTLAAGIVAVVGSFTSLKFR